LGHSGSLLTAGRWSRSTTRTLQELVAYLLMQCGAPVSRQHLAFLLWPDTTEKQARFLQADDLTLQWRNAPDCWVDVTVFEHHLERRPVRCNARKAPKRHRFGTADQYLLKSSPFEVHAVKRL